MIPRRPDLLAAFGHQPEDRFHSHIHERVHASIDNLAGFFVERGNLIAGADLVDAAFVVIVLIRYLAGQMDGWMAGNYFIEFIKLLNLTATLFVSSTNSNSCR